MSGGRAGKVGIQVIGGREAGREEGLKIRIQEIWIRRAGHGVVSTFVVVWELRFSCKARFWAVPYIGALFRQDAKRDLWLPWGNINQQAVVV